MARFLLGQAALCVGLAGLASSIAAAQEHGYWNVPEGDAAHSNWQRAENKITPDKMASDFKFLWKLKLGGQSAKSPGYNAPLLMPGLISSRGFKDLVISSDARSVYAVDSELGTIFWQKDYPATAAKGACGGANIPILMEPPRIVRFGARRPAGAPPTPPPPAPSSKERRVGSVPGGGYFSLKGIYALTQDGYLHEQILSTGVDFAPPVKFLPAPGGPVSGLNMAGLVLYASTARDCLGVPSSVWGLDLNSSDLPLTSYRNGKLAGSMAGTPAIGADGTLYAVTGSASSPTAGMYPNSVVALAPKELKAKDWYTLAESKAAAFNASPIVITYKEKEMVAAFDGSGQIVLLDTGSLGGADHHSPAAHTSRIFTGTKSDDAPGFATWKDKEGTVWLFASVLGPLASESSFPATNGSVSHGSIVAFRIEDKDGKPGLTPAWASGDLVSPAPPVVANGVVFALAGGNSSTPATLYGIDAASGKELYSSRDVITSYTQRAGMSVGDGHVFFTTNDDTLYSFGIPIEH